MTTRQETAQCQHRQSTKTTGYAIRDQWTCDECGTSTGGACGPILQDHENLLATVRALEAEGERLRRKLHNEVVQEVWSQGRWVIRCKLCRVERDLLMPDAHEPGCPVAKPAALVPKPAAGDVGEGVDRG